MCPDLFEIGPVPIRSYGLMMALSFLLGIWYIHRACAKHKRPFEQYLSIAYILIFGGVIGARIAYVLLHWSEFSGHLLDAINPFQPGQFGIAGMNLYGGVLAAIGGAYLYCKWKKLNVLDTFDHFAPTLALGIGISRIGCFLTGCCFGTPTDLPWGVEFPMGSVPWALFGSQHIHPAQLYSSAYGLLLFAYLHYRLNRRKFAGQLVGITFMVEAFFRFVIEYVRYYEDAMIFSLGGVEATYNQVISVLLFVLGAIVYITKRRSGLPEDPSLASQQDTRSGDSYINE
ncbi:MAG: prolipoprotein diacylglyceryl transferase [candidate division Zixibacteria bacterium]|nr:prolipoprotein diacylglyceryl transferase [candidate division Zixibacteria bacterium]